MIVFMCILAYILLMWVDAFCPSYEEPDEDDEIPFYY